MLKPGERDYTMNKMGFIRSAIKGYSGYISIMQELMQNADDALAGYNDSKKYLDIFFLPDSIKITNGSLFTERDFDNITEIAAGGKRDIIDNIGTFGVGFVSVFQITDIPAIYSNGVMVKLDHPQVS